MKKIFNKMGWQDIIIAVFFALVGIIIICYPNMSTNYVNTVLGILFIAVGALKVTDYYTLKDKYDLFDFDIFYGITGIVLGFIAICFDELFSNAFRSLIGMWLIYSGATKLVYSVKINALDKSIGMSSIILAFMIIMCGVFVLIVENASMMLLGLVLIIYAIFEVAYGLIYLEDVDDMMKQSKTKK